MNTPIPVQIALQGGGAKLVYLLAACEAIKELERKEIVKVVRISGTSAGALAACLYASGKDWEKVKSFARDMAHSIKDKFKLPSFLGLVFRLVFRKTSLWDENVIRGPLNVFFGTKRLLNELEIPVVVIASNLNTCSEQVYRNEEGIVDSLMDSCGIPFVFRHVTNMVDGGLCNNLPVMHLADNDPAFAKAPVIAFTFPEFSKSNPTGLREFLLRLFEVSIGNSQNISRSLADYVVTLGDDPNEMVGTLDFEAATEILSSTGVGTKYRALVDQTLVDFHTEIYPDLPSCLAKKGEADETRKQMEKAQSAIYSIYQNQLMSEKCIHSVVGEIIANSLIPGSREKDEMSIRMEFEPISHGIRALEFHVQEPFDSTRWTLTDGNDIEIGITVYRAKQQRGYSTVVIVPERTLEVGSSYVLFIREFCYCLEPLKDGKRDEFFYSPKSFVDKVEEIVLVIYSPKSARVVVSYHEESDVELQQPLSLGWRTKLKERAKADWSVEGCEGKRVGPRGFGIRLAQ